jgi:hypothetical protein
MTLPPANDILLDVSAPTYPIPSYQIHDAAMTWLRRPGWGVAAAQDGLILLRKGAPSRSIPSRFYSFLDAAGKAPERRVHLSFRGLTLLGLDVQSVDQANHRIPNLAYTFFLEARRRLNANYQPIVFQVMDDKVIGCASIPLGLAWMPTSRWRPNHPYLVSLQPLETSWQTPGTASLYVSLRTAVTDPNLTCAALWAHHGQLRSIGTISLPFP